MNGWIGTILRIDLSSGRVMKEPLEEELAHKYIGGRGLNIKILYDETKPGIDPLGPDNKLILGAGPCNGTLAPGNSRLTLTARSPITGFFGCSSSGGSFGAEIKYAGYDVVIIEGKAGKPVYLWIDDDNVELRDAGQLWGKKTQEARRTLQKEIGHPDAAVVCIGPAGENLVKFACVMSDLGRAHGRTGMGAVMGSKKLKAIAIRGTKGVKVAHNELLSKAANELLHDWRGNALYEQQAALGAPAYEQPLNEVFGTLPCFNFRRGTWDKAKPLYAEHLQKDYYLKSRTCFSCPTPCDHVYVITKGRFAGTWGIGMQVGQQMWFGSNVGVNNLEIVARASALCDEYGLDIAEIGNIISYAMECFEKGILTLKDTGGLELKWGNGDVVLKLLEMTAYRQGIGDLFAEGLKRASEQIGKGSERFAAHVKGLAFDTIDPRGHKGWALGYAVAGRGAEHCMGMLLTELGVGGWDPVRGECWDGEKVDPLREEGKGVMYKWAEDVRAFQNIMQVCEFPYMNPFAPKIGQPAMAAKIYNAVTGLGISEKEVMRIGERVVNLEHAYNIREGWTRKDDTLPERFLKETLPEGPAKGQVVKLEPMVQEYYQSRGWDKHSGLPTKGKLLELGLEEVANELESMGKLG